MLPTVSQLAFNYSGGEVAMWYRGGYRGGYRGLGGKELPPFLGGVLGSRGNIVRIGSQHLPPKPRVWDKVYNP